MTSPLNFPFRIKTSNFNTSNVDDLASALAQSFSVNGTTGIVCNSMNIKTLHSTNIVTTGATINNATISNATISNANITNFTGTVSTPVTTFIESWPIFGGQIASVNTNISFKKQGNQVSIYMPDWSITQHGASTVTIGSNNIPTGFYPSASYVTGANAGDLYFSMWTYDNGVDALSTVDFNFELLPSANFLISTNPAGGTFSGTGQLSNFSTIFTYMTD